MVVCAISIRSDLASKDTVDHQIQPGDDVDHTSRPLGGVLLDAIHYQLGHADGNLAFELVRCQALLRLVQPDRLDLLGDQCRDVLAGQRPVHRRAEIEDVGAGPESPSADLLGRDVIGRALDPRLDGPDGTALTEVDDLDRTALVDQDVVGLDVTVDEPGLVHGAETGGDHAKDQQDIAQTQSGAFLERLAVEVFHGQQKLSDSQEAANLAKLVAFADVRMVDALSDLVLVFSLLEDPAVLRFFVGEAFERDGRAVLVIGGQIDRAAGSAADALDDREPPHTEYIFGHTIANLTTEASDGSHNFI